jgi:NTE family protein
MPVGSEGVEDGTGLALSGGGFRAALFHLGSLWRLTELGLLHKVTRVASVSGGSITSGVLAVAWNEFARAPTVDTYKRLVVQPLRAFCRLQIDARAIGEGVFLPWKSAAESIEEKYSEHLFSITLDQLPETPRFVFNSTNLQTGRSFRFSKPYMGDYRIGLIEKPALPLARAIAASSAFPPFLSPVILDKPGTFRKVDGADLHGQPEYTQRIYLSDGGVYDNLGLETVWNRFRTVLVSDAGAPFSIGETVETDWIKQTIRALDVATDQARALRKRALIDDFKRKERVGAYWGIDTDIEDYELADAMPCRKSVVKPLASMRTRLNSFNDREQEQLINWGYALCDAALRRHAPELASGTHQVAPQWPYPAHSLDRT